ncbi:MAG: hypothetical protein LBQ79_03150 [Deltaproteobacteria bacterium]|jgi:hypothetical protein|nr:hypothetical protein [Deltaproteobacteria bacterium]
MSSRSYVNMTPERRKMMEEARRRREEAARELRAAVEKALAAREERLKALVAAQRAELAREAASRLRSSGKLETAAEAEARAGGAAAAEAREAEAAALEVMSKIRAYFQELRGESPESAAALQDLVGEVREGMDGHRLDLIFDAVRAALAKEITGSMRTGMFRKELEAMVAARPCGAPGDDMVNRAARLMAARRIRNEDMDAMRLDYLKLREEDRVAAETGALLKRAREVLSERGYRLLDARGRPVLEGLPLARDGTYWFAGANRGYRVRAQVDAKGGLNLQQLRVVASREEAKENPTQYDREVELWESQKWCGAQDALVDALAAENAKCVHTVHRKAGEYRLPILVDKDKESFGRISAAAAGGTLREAMSFGDGDDRK